MISPWFAANLIGLVCVIVVAIVGVWLAPR